MSRPKKTGSRITPRGTTPESRVRADRTRRRAPTAHNVDRAATQVEPPPSNRYTPPERNDLTFRPQWHRVVGWIGVACGLLIVILNDGMLLTEDVTLLPFGHSEFYLMVGVLVAGWSTRFLGLFDRETVYG